LNAHGVYSFLETKFKIFKAFQDQISPKFKASMRKIDRCINEKGKEDLYFEAMKASQITTFVKGKQCNLIS